MDSDEVRGHPHANMSLSLSLSPRTARRSRTTPRTRAKSSTSWTQVRGPQLVHSMVHYHNMDYIPTRWPQSPRTAVQRAPGASTGPDHLGLCAVWTQTRTTSPRATARAPSPRRRTTCATAVLPAPATVLSAVAYVFLLLRYLGGDGIRRPSSLSLPAAVRCHFIVFPQVLRAHSSLRFRALQSPQVLRGQSNRGCVAVASRCSRAHRVTPSKDVIRVTRPHRLNPMAFRIRMTQTPSTRLPSCGATPASGAAPPSQLQSLWTVPTAAVS